LKNNMIQEGTRSSSIAIRHTVPTRITKCTQFGQLILRKIIKIVATRCQILRLKCTKFDYGWGSAPDPAGGAYSAPPNSLAKLKGLLLRGGKEGEGKGTGRDQEKGKGREGKGKGRGKEGGTGMGRKV